MISLNIAVSYPYDYGDVSRSLLIATLASYVSFDVARRARNARGWACFSWLSGAGAAMGIGIWLMHLKGIVACRLPMPVVYSWPVVMVSLLVAVFASVISLYVVNRGKKGTIRFVAGSFIMGAGISLSHYVAISAMRALAVAGYSPLLVAASVVLAIALSLLALVLAFDLRGVGRWTLRRRFGSATAMGLAVSAMHYTAMAGTRFIPAPLQNLTSAVVVFSVGNFGVIIVTLVLIVGTLITSSVDRRAHEETRRLNQELEDRVAERTAVLAEVIKELRKEISDRKQAEDDLRQSEDRLRLVIDTIPQQIWSGPADGSLDFCNLQWRSFMGFSQEDLQGNGWQRMLHPDDRERVIRAWRECVDTGVTYEQEERHRRADGKYHWFLARGVPLRDADGKILRWYGTNTDIEDRKQAGDRLRLVIDSTPALLYSANPDGDLDYFNKTWLDFLGLPLHEVCGWRWIKAVHADDVDDLIAKWRVSLETGEPYEAEGRIRRFDGEYRWLLHRKLPLRDAAGKIIKWYGSSVDIEDRRRAEEALQEAHYKLAHITRTQAMGELVAAIAHEVNQPLTAVITNGDFCLRSLRGVAPNLNELRGAIAEIVNDGNRASAILSRIRGSLIKGTPAKTELNINQVAMEVIVLMRHELSRNHLSWSTNLATDLPPVFGDPVQLQQVLVNLIMNSIQAMRGCAEGQRKLFIRSAAIPGGISMQVQDSGPGIAPGVANRIFEPFVTTKAEGIGMGLSISRSIIESHGGQLSLIPVAEGALFQFTLPGDPDHVHD
jgi:PAS domain S-box-containing protein